MGSQLPRLSNISLDLQSIDQEAGIGRHMLRQISACSSLFRGTPALLKACRGPRSVFGLSDQSNKPKGTLHPLKLSNNSEQDLSGTGTIAVVEGYLARMADGALLNSDINQVRQFVRAARPDDLSHAGLVALCKLYSIIASEDKQQKKFWKRVEQKVVQTLTDEIDQLSSHAIIMFCQFLFLEAQPQSTARAYEVCKERFNKFTFQQKLNYVDSLSHLLILSQARKQIKNLMIDQLSELVPSLSIDQQAQLFARLSRVSNSLFQTSRLVKSLMKNLVLRFDEVSPGRYASLLQVREYRHEFLPQIWTKVRSQSIVPEIVFSVLGQAFQEPQFRKDPGIINQITKFIEENLDRKEQVVGLLRRKVLPQSAVIQILKSVNQNNVQAYQRNIDYLILVSQMGDSTQNQQHLVTRLEQIEREMAVGNQIGQQFVRLAVRTYQLTGHKNRHVGSAMRRYLLAGVSNDSWSHHGCPTLAPVLQEFDSIYGPEFVGCCLKAVIDGQSEFTFQFYEYLALTARTDLLAEIYNTTIGKVAIEYFSTLLLSKASASPDQFRGHFNTLTAVCQKFIPAGMHWQKYLLDRNVHQALGPDQVQSYLKLGRAYLLKSKVRHLEALMENFIKSSCKWFRASHEYTLLLHSAQLVKLSRPPNTLPFLSVLEIEICKLNLQVSSYQGILNSKQQGAAGEAWVPDAPIEEGNLHQVVQAGLGRDYLFSKMPSIKAAIHSCSISSLEKAFLSFQLPQNEASTKVLERIVAKYAQKIHNHPRSIYRLELVLWGLIDTPYQHLDISALLEALLWYFQTKAVAFSSREVLLFCQLLRTNGRDHNQFLEVFLPVFAHKLANNSASPRQLLPVLGLVPSLEGEYCQAILSYFEDDAQLLSSLLTQLVYANQQSLNFFAQKIAPDLNAKGVALVADPITRNYLPYRLSAGLKIALREDDRVEFLHREFTQNLIGILTNLGVVHEVVERNSQKVIRAGNNYAIFVAGCQSQFCKQAHKEAIKQYFSISGLFNHLHIFYLAGSPNLNKIVSSLSAIFQLGSNQPIVKEIQMELLGAVCARGLNRTQADYFYMSNIAEELQDIRRGRQK